MKIKETIERDCCDARKDLVLMKKVNHTPFYFCRHCGRHWTEESYMDPAGSRDYRLVQIPLPWECTDDGK